MHYKLQFGHNSTRVVLHLHPTYTIAAMKKGIQLYHLAGEFPELRRYTKVGVNVPVVEPVSMELADAVCKNFKLNSNGELDCDIHGVS